jgi:PTS system galactitol-specific IIC component
MEYLVAVMAWINKLGVSVFLPFLVAAIGLFFKMRLMKALRSGLLIGAGFIGINTLVGIVVSSLRPLAAYYATLGSGFTATPVGWEIAGSVAWSTPFAVVIVPLGFALNFVLLKLRVTKTLNVDLWNYWYFMLNAMYAWYTATALGASNVVAAIIGTTVGLFYSVVACLLADLTAKYWQTHYGLEGTSCTTQLIHFLWFFTWVCNKIIDKIPGINKIEITVDSLRNSKLSFLSDVPVVSFLFLAIICVVSRQSLAVSLSTSVSIMAAIVLLPRMVALLMEGLAPIGTAAHEFMVASMRKKGGKGEDEDLDIYIGMDVALSLGDPCGLACIPLVIPITLALQFILPVNYIFVYAISSALYSTCAISMITKGNIPKTVILFACRLTVVGLITTWLSPSATQVFHAFSTTLTGDVAADSTANFFNTVIFLVGKALGAY